MDLNRGLTSSAVGKQIVRLLFNLKISHKCHLKKDPMSSSYFQEEKYFNFKYKSETNETSYDFCIK